MDKGYAQVLYAFWIDSPFFARVQLALLVVAWLHGCYGVWFWLRLKPWFGAWRSVLTSAAVLPCTRVAGFLQGGREVAALAQDPVWRAAAIRPATIGTPPQNLWLAGLRTDFLLFDGGALLLVLAARLTRTVRERRGGRFAILYPNGRKVLAPHGFSVLRPAVWPAFPMPAPVVVAPDARSAGCVCSVTCRYRRPPGRSSVFWTGWARTRRHCDSLASCGQPMISGVATVPPAASAAFLQRSQQDVMPQERFAAFMFVDMRDSTRLAAAQLPFDSIFVVSRFMGAVCSAVVQAGGQPNQFLETQCSPSLG
jgi:adenylate cyclase